MPPSPRPDVHHLGQEDVAPADAEAQAHGLPDVGPGDRQQHLADRLPLGGAQRVGGLQVRVVHRVHRRHEEGHEVDDEGQGQEHDLLHLAGPEEREGEGDEGGDRQVGAEHRQGSEGRLDLGERAHQHPEGERDREGQGEALEHAPERHPDVAGQLALEPQLREGGQDLRRRGEDGGRDDPLLGGAGGHRHPGEEEGRHREDRPAARPATPAAARGCAGAPRGRPRPAAPASRARAGRRGAAGRRPVVTSLPAGRPRSPRAG